MDLKWGKHKDWSDVNEPAISQLQERKRGLYVSTLQNKPSIQPFARIEYTESKCLLQRELRRRKNVWWSKVSTEILWAFNKKDLMLFYGLVREFFFFFFFLFVH